MSKLCHICHVPRLCYTRNRPYKWLVTSTARTSRSERNHRRIVFRDIEEQRTVLDGPIEDEDLETARAGTVGREADVVDAVLLVCHHDRDGLALVVNDRRGDRVAAGILEKEDRDRSWS